MPSLRRPLIDGETGLDFSGSGVNNNGRDPYLLRRLKYGMLALGNLFYGVCLTMLFTPARSTATGYNLIEGSGPYTYSGSDGARDGDFARDAMIIDRPFGNLIPFVAKTWRDYSRGWQVWFNQAQVPIAGDNTVCPWAEWNRVTFANNRATMTAGGRNVIATAESLPPTDHVFRADVLLTGTGAQARLFVRGYDKLDGNAETASQTLTTLGTWTTLQVRFTPRQHGNPRVPDPRVCVLLVDHNGVGTCEVQNPTITALSY